MRMGDWVLAGGAGGVRVRGYAGVGAGPGGDISRN